MWIKKLHISLLSPKEDGSTGFCDRLGGPSSSVLVEVGQSEIDKQPMIYLCVESNGQKK